MLNIYCLDKLPQFHVKLSVVLHFSNMFFLLILSLGNLDGILMCYFQLCVGYFFLFFFIDTTVHDISNESEDM